MKRGIPERYLRTLVAFAKYDMIVLTMVAALSAAFSVFDAVPPPIDGKGDAGGAQSARAGQDTGERSDATIIRYPRVTIFIKIRSRRDRMIAPVQPIGQTSSVMAISPCSEAFDGDNDRISLTEVPAGLSVSPWQHRPWP